MHYYYGLFRGNSLDTATPSWLLPFIFNVPLPPVCYTYISFVLAHSDSMENSILDSTRCIGCYEFVLHNIW